MNITLTDILTKASSGQTNQTGGAVSAAAIAKQIQTTAALNNLVPGQTISGLVRAAQGSSILLDIGNGVEINARLDGDILAAVGRNMLFEVKSNSGDKLMLSPLYTNLSAGKSTAADALNAAGMPLTGNNITMVNSMMEEGMPIDKSSLWEMGKAVSDFPQASADTIVRLTAMGMELNETNVMQYEATQNMQHQLLYTMEDITEGLGQVLSSFGEDGQALEGLQFMKDMLQILQESGVENEALPEENGVGTKSLTAELDALIKELGGNKEEAAEIISGKQGKAVTGEEEAAKALIQDTAKNSAPPVKANLIITEDGRVRLPDGLEERFEELQKEFTKEVKNLLSESWTIKPERFSEKEEVKNFYQKIREQSGQLQELFSSTGKINTPAGQAVNQMNQNLNFMQNLNQLFPYLQIPMKASMENAHGELYVYQRKKGKVSEDGSASALLHLEMQHLGNMDIYVKMKDFNVSTQFTLADETVLDFLAEHIHVLNERLEKKGYHMQAEMKFKEEAGQESVMSKIRGVEENDAVISYTSFDVRA